MVGFLLAKFVMVCEHVMKPTIKDMEQRSDVNFMQSNLSDMFLDRRSVQDSTGVIVCSFAIVVGSAPEFLTVGA